MISEELQKKIDRAIRLIKLYDNPENPIEVAYSGGKDSDVILQPTREAGIHYRAIYKNTTIDPPYTIKHCKENGVEIMKPKRTTFFEIVSKKGFPNRFRRFCCSELKEYKILDKAMMGVRKSESVKRASRYKEPTECRFYGSKKEHVEAVYPILDWSLQDIADFINDRKIKLHPLYYLEDGTIDFERRLGCMCCPLASVKKRLREFKEHPRMVKFYCKAGAIYLENHPQYKERENYKDVYEYFTRDTFFEKEQDWQAFKNGIFNTDDFDYKTFLEDYFNIKL